MADNKKNEPAPAAPPAGENTAGMANANVPAVAAPSIPTISGGQVELAGRKFTVKQITRNVFPQRDNQTLFIQFVGAVYQGEKLANVTGDKAKMDPAKLAEVVNLETGELGLIIINTVLEGELNSKYADNAYIGREFAITMKSVEGKRYKAFTLFELEPTN